MPEAPDAGDVLVVGDWHLASTAAAALVKLSYRVYWQPGPSFGAGPVGHDVRRQAEELAEGNGAAGEPGVTGILAAARRHRRLMMIVDEVEIASAVKSCAFSVVAQDSQTDADGASSDDRPFRSALRLLTQAERRGPVVVMSQVRAGTSDAVLAAAHRPADTPDLVHMPKNLRLGRSLADFLSPHRVIAGCNAVGLPQAVARFVEALVPRGLHATTLVEAELAKHATNAYLAACITLANDVGAVAHRLGADPQAVMDAVRADPRVSDTAPLRPGAAYAGATLQRDVRALADHGAPIGRDGLFLAVSRSNAVHALGPLAVLDRILEGVTDRRICLLGLTYKPGTSTVRDSPALLLANELLGHGARVTAFDPVAESVSLPGVERRDALVEAAEGADCLVLVVEHPAFADPGAWAGVAPKRRLLIRLAGEEDRSCVATPAGWTSVSPWTA